MPSVQIINEGVMDVYAYDGEIINIAPAGGEAMFRIKVVETKKGLRLAVTPLHMEGGDHGGVTVDSFGHGYDQFGNHRT
jgi:hypothetical protein